MNKTIFTLIVLCFVIPFHMLAQGGSPEYKSGMTVKLDSTGHKYIRFLTWATIWARHTEANPGTAVNGLAGNSYDDLSIRQFRFVVVTQLSPRYLILAGIGMDNQTFSSGGTPGGGNTGNGGPSYNGTLGKKTGLYLHDLWNEYAIIPDKNSETQQENPFSIYLGTGLHYWNGISRMTSSSSANYLALDVPLYNWPLVDLSDQFARQLGIYIKGNATKLSYRIAVNKPFTVLSTPTAFPDGSLESTYAVDNNAPGKIATTGYAAWQFFEKENQLLPYTTGTYAGTMKVLNVGAGYYNTSDGTVTQKENTENSGFNRHPINIWAIDAFADLPFGGSSNWAFTGYTVFYHYDFGPNYLRYSSIMNENVSADPNFHGKVSQAGFGNLAPVIGTGHTWFTQAGLLLPKTILKGKVRLQPYGEFSLQRFDRFGNANFTYWSAGGNIFLDGHHARITFKYQTRPIVIDNIQASSKGTLIFAAQVYL